MDQMGYNADRTPFTNISNTIITGNQNESNSLGPIVDARERKRQRDRERYAAMTVEQKNEKNRKRREARQRNKGLPIKTQSSIDSFPDDCSTIDFKILSTQGIAGGDEQVNVDPDDDSDWLHRNETFQANNIVASNDLLTTGCVHESVDNTPNHTMKRAAYFSERYKNLTPVERESRRERLRLYNKTPRRKDAKTEYGRKRRALQSDTFNQESIAMEDPTYTPEVGRHRTDATQPYGSSVTTCDWVIPEFVGTPFLPTSIQTEDVGSLTMSTEPLSRKHHVLSGARPAILGSRNQQFEAAISRNVATVTEDTISDAVEGDDWTQPHTTTEIHNNVQCTNPCQGATLATNVSEGMAEQRVQHTHTKPKVISDGDDDEGVIFEEDDDDNDGYLFAGQYDETDEDIKIDGTQDESIDTDLPDTYNKVYSNMPEETHMLKSVPNCGYCNAKKFEYEPPGFCCRGGKVELAPLETPPQLWRLWDSADSDARHFRDNIRFFNGHFSFTSLYCCLDSKTTNVRDSGIYTFRAQGMMYHNIKSFGREGGAEHKHLELYFYDDDPNLEHRYRMCREEHQQKDKDVIKQIVSILRENPYSEHLRSMGHVENLDDYRITLNLDQSLNQKTYNTPITSEVAAVWIEGSERRGQFSKSVMLHGKDRFVQGYSIQYFMLQLHLPNMHMVAFHDRQMVQRVVNRPGADRVVRAKYGNGGNEIRVDKSMPSALRRLFATILVYCEPSDVAVLWRKHLDAMSEDYQRRSESKTHVEQMVLIDIRNMLQSMGKDIKTFPLPPIIDTYDDAIGTAREVYEEESIEPTVADVALKETLNEEQRAAYDKIMSAVDTDQGGLFFVGGPGGTGKTYLYRVLLATLRSQNKIAVATATSGVAASIMPGGRTAHSRFKIPLTIDDGVVCSFMKQSGTAELLRKASLIIWDEASMTKRQAVEALDNSMRDVMGRPGLPFGGKTIVFGGDFRQVLPVVRKGSRAQVVASSLRMSYLWESMSHLKLVSNMRAKNDPWFAEFLLRIGGGTEVTNRDGDIRLPGEGLNLKQVYTRSLIAAFCFHAYQQVVIHLADIGAFTVRVLPAASAALPIARPRLRRRKPRSQSPSSEQRPSILASLPAPASPARGNPLYPASQTSAPQLLPTPRHHCR
eukprot:XP_020406492.1 uncharacterized protein LOC109945102 [Zea mays]